MLVCESIDLGRESDCVCDILTNAHVKWAKRASVREDACRMSTAEKEVIGPDAISERKTSVRQHLPLAGSWRLIKSTNQRATTTVEPLLTAMQKKRVQRHPSNQ